MKKKRFGEKKTVTFVQRAVALRKLGISLALFRKMCILKGIYPKVSTTKQLSKDKVYYSINDIRSIRHDPILSKLVRNRLIDKKIKTALNKSQKLKADKLQYLKEQIDLKPVIRERYPTLASAIYDLSDALCCLAIFALHKSDSTSGIDAKLINKCQQLMVYWYNFCAETKCLHKTFASVKGLYISAKILDIDVIWIQPYNLPVEQEPDVDLKVLATFLNLYTTLVESILFKLYSLQGYKYPPQKISKHTNSSDMYLNCKIIKAEPEEIIINTDSSAQVKLFNDTDDDKKRQTLFSNQVFFVTRENMLFQQLVLLLRAFGAKNVGFTFVNNKPNAKNLSPISEDCDAITHQVCDLPENAYKALKQKLGSLTLQRQFIQPQWIFDSINTVTLQQADIYETGKPLIPHLSPFDPSSYMPDVGLKLPEDNKPADVNDEATLDPNTEERALMLLSSHKRKLYKKLKMKEQQQQEYITRINDDLKAAKASG